MAMQVTLEDHTGNMSHQAKMVENVPVQRLIPAIVTALGLPITDSAGRPITYHLSHNNRRLQEDETLESAGVRSGDTLTVVPEMTAGGSGLAPYSMYSGEPLVILGPIIREQCPSPGFPRTVNPALQRGTVQVHIVWRAMQNIWEHTVALKDREAGGILLGQVYQEKGKFLVVVEEGLPAFHTRAGPASLTFTAGAWLEILARRSTRPGMSTVGWYHSHPGMGVFLSGADRFSHRAFFGRQPWYVALVVDPLSRECGAFAWEDEEIKPCPEFVVV